MKNQKEQKLQAEISTFQNLWKGGTTLARQGWDACVKTRAGSVDLNTITERCITPYINKDTMVLEIGCNGGGWTHKFLNAKEIHGSDLLSAEHTGFWENMPPQPNIFYHRVSDFLCEEFRDNSIDYVFSYDVFCHISYTGTCAYLKNLYPKLRSGTNCFIMIADPEKYQDLGGRAKLTHGAGFSNFEEFVADYDGAPTPGRWYFYGTERFCSAAIEAGYEIIDKDIAREADKRSPIIHLKKK
jgi:hypothetical protein